MIESNKSHIEIVLGDITSLNVDIIVNAANNSLLGGGGVDGRIHYMAGPELLEECRTLGGCKDGEAKITNAYNLPCKKIIHTVGPVYRGGNYNEEIVLENCYINSMKIAEEYRMANNLDKITIAFPCISTGVFRYPKDKACNVAVSAIEKCKYNNINVLFVCYNEDDYKLYNERLNRGTNL